jgi:hypothetical protein
MKEKQIVKLKAILVAVAVLAAIIILPIETHAQVTCPTTSTADSDGDGFTDAQECAGITLNLAQGVPQVTFPACTPSLNRASCMDPNSKDLFVIAVRANPSLIPTDPYKFVGAALSGGGLGITVHEITEAQVAADRKVTSVSLQKAARLQESRDTSDPNVLGSSNQGIALDLATTFTQRIANLVNSVCVTGTTCVDSNSATNGINTATLVIQHFIRHDIAHELGHCFALAPDYNSRFGGNHYQAGANVVLEQNVTYSKKGTKVTWYISTAYTATDQAAVKLQ